MLVLNKLNNFEYLKQKQIELIKKRRTVTPFEQKTINIELNIIYNAKYKILKELSKCKN